MKLTNLSLAILVAVGVAACGGSDDNNSNRPMDPKAPSNPRNNNNNKNNQADSKQTVDPTGTNVVDNKDLTKVSTVGTLQYVRREGSQYDRANNPSKAASASPLLGVTLNNQNPSLTNIVLARQELTRADGQPVKAQFAGSSNPNPLKSNGEFQQGDLGSVSLQEENFKNVDVLAGMYQARDGVTAVGSPDEGKAGKQVTNNVDANGAINTRPLTDGKKVFNAVVTTTGSPAGDNYPRKFSDLTSPIKPDDISNIAAGDKDKAYNMSPREWSTLNSPLDKYKGPGVYSTDGKEGYTAIIDPATWKKAIAEKTLESGVNTKDGKGQDIYYYRGITQAANKDGNKLEPIRKTVTAKFAHTHQNGSRYGKGLVWWSTPETAFENEFTRRGTDRIATNDLDDANKLLGKDNAGITELKGDSRAATNGLVRIGGGLSTLGEETKFNSATGKWEDHHNTTTRIFGRYHLAYSKDNTTKQVSLNSYSGARTFVAEYDAKNENRATQYSLGAKPMTLTRVQYGRVSNNLDLDAGQTGYRDNFMRSDFVRKNNDGGVDNYFYRGVDATSIEQMAALPSNQSAVYHGHALMYGIDNSFHGSTGNKGRDLPNAFAPAGSTAKGIGLGNFVEARVNFGTKRVTGEVYNTWLLDPTKNVTTKDKLVQFQGKITGNTVVGSADRAYLAGDDNATFKASFFGDKAQEMGGSFNSVKDTDRYSDAYGTNDWGGVFGATRGETNTFQGDDGKNVYTD
ncbi:Uncharacterised protein [Cardiobacterium valvarum]|uniref:Transferrin-binding protein B C-lobe/N-lobe beta-barrel domain-containing protein n=3 Tax=Cardiobacterium valvarum TaxID=194702 RepID=A0A381EEF6_9GAMM|nr:Uncharacterised protein [Cardiobacterium valvarum]